MNKIIFDYLELDATEESEYNVNAFCISLANAGIESEHDTGNKTIEVKFNTLEEAQIIIENAGKFQIM